MGEDWPEAERDLGGAKESQRYYTRGHSLGWGPYGRGLAQGREGYGGCPGELLHPWSWSRLGSLWERRGRRGEKEEEITRIVGPP